MCCWCCGYGVSCANDGAAPWGELHCRRHPERRCIGNNKAKQNVQSFQTRVPDSASPGLTYHVNEDPPRSQLKKGCLKLQLMRYLAGAERPLLGWPISHRSALLNGNVHFIYRRTRDTDCICSERCLKLYKISLLHRGLTGAREILGRRVPSAFMQV